MKMRPSRVLRKLRAGETVSCFNVHFDSQASEIAALAGFDCLWIDNEHQSRDYSAIREHIMAAKQYDMDVMVRVPRGSSSDYIKPLEARKRVGRRPSGTVNLPGYPPVWIRCMR